MFGLWIVKGAELEVMADYIVCNRRGEGIAYGFRCYGVTYVRPLAHTSVDGGKLSVTLAR